MVAKRPENRLVDVLSMEESMMRKLSTWLVVVSAAGLLLTGCGSGGSSTVTQTVPSVATTTPTTATKAPSTTTSKPATATKAPGATTNPTSTTTAPAPATTTPASSATGTGKVIPLTSAARACLERVSHMPAGKARLRALGACKAN
jgi:hypothetical protein